jgi:copper chaperone
MNTPGGYKHLFELEGRIMRDRVRLSIEGMHCEGCVRRVAAVLRGVKGVEPDSVEVGSAQVSFDPERASAEEIAAAVDHIGFSSRVEKR